MAYLYRHIRLDNNEPFYIGIGNDQGSEDPHDVIEAGQLGYCRFLKLKCAAARTCDAWVVGGPITDNK